MNATIGNTGGALAYATLLIFTASGCAEGAGERLAHGGTASPVAVVETPRWSAKAEDRDFSLAVHAKRGGVPTLVAFDLEDLDDGRARRQRH